jgi:hypothetical protein
MRDKTKERERERERERGEGGCSDHHKSEFAIAESRHARSHYAINFFMGEASRCKVHRVQISLRTSIDRSSEAKARIAIEGDPDFSKRINHHEIMMMMMMMMMTMMLARTRTCALCVLPKDIQHLSRQRMMDHS